MLHVCGGGRNQRPRQQNKTLAHFAHSYWYPSQCLLNVFNEGVDKVLRSLWSPMVGGLRGPRYQGLRSFCRVILERGRCWFTRLVPAVVALRGISLSPKAYGGPKPGAQTGSDKPDAKGWLRSGSAGQGDWAARALLSGARKGRG
jgi:hypothetical protein